MRRAFTYFVHLELLGEWVPFRHGLIATGRVDNVWTRLHFGLGFHSRSSFTTSNLRCAFTRFIQLELVRKVVHALYSTAVGPALTLVFVFMAFLLCVTAFRLGVRAINRPKPSVRLESQRSEDGSACHCAAYWPPRVPEARRPMHFDSIWKATVYLNGECGPGRLPSSIRQTA